jgi:hypothetical protein
MPRAALLLLLPAPPVQALPRHRRERRAWAQAVEPLGRCVRCASGPRGTAAAGHAQHCADGPSRNWPVGPDLFSRIFRISLNYCKLQKFAHDSFDLGKL